MEEQKRPLDPTRRLLRVFGVGVTNYEERFAALLEQAAAAKPAELLRLAAEALDLTVEMNARLRELNTHVLDTQARVLAELNTALEQARS